MRLEDLNSGHEHVVYAYFEIEAETTIEDGVIARLNKAPGESPDPVSALQWARLSYSLNINPLPQLRTWYPHVKWVYGPGNRFGYTVLW